MSNTQDTKVTIAIVGSRVWPLESAVRDLVRALQAPPGGEIRVISGGAHGPDQWAIEEARHLGLETRVFRAEWTKDGKLDRSAGFRRNTELVAHADRIIAFWDGLSSGTNDTVQKGLEAGVPVLLVVVDPEDDEKVILEALMPDEQPLPRRPDPA